VQWHNPRDETLQVTVNGQRREVPDGTTVAQLLEAIGVNTRYVAVEYGRHELHDGDKLEVVTLVGGG
jgi:thiamine biosynthesis protein ThiS